MKTFTLHETGMAKPLEYCVLKCSNCKNAFRHDINLIAFGRKVKTRVCSYCGKKVKVDEGHALDHDPLLERRALEFYHAVKK